MKRIYLVFLVVMLLAVLAVGCASIPRVDTLEKRVGIQEFENKMVREKMDKIVSSQEIFSKDLVATRTQLTELSNATNEAISQLKRSNAKNEADIQGLAKKSEDLEKGIGLVRTEMRAEIKGLETRVEERFADLRSYIRAYLPTLRRVVAEREARHSYKADEVEGLVVCFSGPFEDGKSEINNKNELSFEKALAQLKDYEILEVHCFADKRGFKGKTAEESTKMNVELSTERGKKTQAWLKAKGIDLPDEKIHAFGSTEKFGDERDCRTVIFFGKKKPPTPPQKTQ